MKLHKVVTGMLAAGVLVSACSGGDIGDASTSPAPTPTTVIEPAPTRGPVATAVPSTAVPEPSATVDAAAAAEPTATPDAQAEQDAAVIAAWERYLELSFAARGKDPSPQALDFDSYVTGGAKDGLLGALDRESGDGVYLTGTVVSSDLTFFYFETGDARLTDCVDVDLVFIAMTDADPSPPQQGRFTVEARLESSGDSWVVAAYEAGDSCDE